MKVYLSKSAVGLIPSDPASSEWFSKLKPGQVVGGEFKKVRNYAFLKKYFALLNVAYEQWEPGDVSSKYGIVEKNFDRFRADLIILAGFYDVTVRLDGSTRIEPKSISFAKMNDETFADLYSKTIDVLLKHVYDKEMDAEKLNSIVEQYLQFV